MPQLKKEKSNQRMKSPHMQRAHCHCLTYPWMSVLQHSKVQGISISCHIPGPSEMHLQKLFNPPLQHPPSALQQEKGTFPCRFYYYNCPDTCQEYQQPVEFVDMSRAPQQHGSRSRMTKLMYELCLTLLQQVLNLGP